MSEEYWKKLVKDLKLQISKLELQRNGLQQRIDKAIEIIKLCNTPCAKELLEILGGDKENE